MDPGVCRFFFGQMGWVLRRCESSILFAVYVLEKRISSFIDGGDV